jgi:hypothetical protein
MWSRWKRDGRLAIMSGDPSGSEGTAPDWSVKKREAVVVEENERFKR